MPRSAASTATTLAARAVADDDHQHELAAPARRADGRRAHRDGAPRPAGRGDAVHARRGDEPGLAGRRARPAERRGAVPRRPRRSSSGPARRWSTAPSPRTSTCGPARPRSGRPSTVKGAIASGQLARRYRLPWRSSNATASSVVDAQAAYESEMAVWGAVMGGVNLLYQGAGWLEGGLTASFEKLIVDAEILQMMSEVLQPLVVDEASARVRGDRRGRARAATSSARPTRSSATRPRSTGRCCRTGATSRRGQADGARTATERANTIWKQLLADASPPTLDPPSPRRSTRSSRGASARSHAQVGDRIAAGRNSEWSSPPGRRIIPSGHPDQSRTAVPTVAPSRGRASDRAAEPGPWVRRTLGARGWCDADVDGRRRASGARVAVGDALQSTRGLHAAYARERIEEVIRAIVGGCPEPEPDRTCCRGMTRPLFEADLRAPSTEITEATTILAGRARCASCSRPLRRDWSAAWLPRRASPTGHDAARPAGARRHRRRRVRRRRLRPEARAEQGRPRHAHRQERLPPVPAAALPGRDLDAGGRATSPTRCARSRPSSTGSRRKRARGRGRSTRSPQTVTTRTARPTRATTSSWRPAPSRTSSGRPGPSTPSRSTRSTTRSASDADHPGLRGGGPRPAPGRRGRPRLRRRRRRADRGRGRRRPVRDDQHDDGPRVPVARAAGQGPPRRPRHRSCSRCSPTRATPTRPGSSRRTASTFGWASGVKAIGPGT